MYTLHQGAPTDARAENESAVYAFLDTLRLPYVRIDHAPVRTMEDCLAIDRALGGEICKNLFLCNQQKTVFYLMLIQETKAFRTKDISKQLGVSRLSFGPAEAMTRLLHLSSGAVSPMGLLFDSAKEVRLLMDRDLLSAAYLGCHPCVNTASAPSFRKSSLVSTPPTPGSPTYTGKAVRSARPSRSFAAAASFTF